MIFFKKFFLIIIFFFITNSVSVANDKIAFIDLEFLFDNTNIGKLISENLKKINTNNVNKIKLEEKKLINKEKEIKKTQNIISENELKLKINNLKDEVNLFNKNKKQIYKNFDIEKNKQLDSFFIKITPIIQNYMDQNSISLLLEKKNIFIGKSNIDITNEILKIINNTLE